MDDTIRFCHKGFEDWLRNPIFDPHIEEYNHAELVLLDAVKNNLTFETESLEQQEYYMSLFSWKQKNATLRRKSLVKVIDNFNELVLLLNTTNKNPFLNKKGIEGYVFEDSSPTKNMFKIKTDWYSFWKFMRSMKDRISSQLRKNATRKQASATLDKSQLISLKSRLHTEDDIKVFSWMVKLAEEDIESFSKMSIIDIRNSIPE